MGLLFAGRVYSIRKEALIPAAIVVSARACPWSPACTSKHCSNVQSGGAAHQQAMSNPLPIALSGLWVKGNGGRLAVAGMLAVRAAS